MKANVLKCGFCCTLLAAVLCGPWYSQPSRAEQQPWELMQQGAKTVNGLVLDENGEAVIGATVKLSSNPSKGALTNVEGKFVLSDIKPGDVLEISYMGYISQTLRIDEKDSYTIHLKPDTQLLDEIVVVGYGTQKKVNLTGAVSSVDAKTLQTRPVQNVSQALQGVVPGLNLTVGGDGGALDSRLGINIRGVGTIGAGSFSAPLVLIDGTEGDINSLNPQDIESLSVLKDASSSSIYGSRAAFGVILITTKSGKNAEKDRKVQINYNGNVRFASATQLPHMMNSLQFAQYWNAAAANIGGNRQFSDEIIEKIKRYQEDPNAEGVKYGTQWDEKRKVWSIYQSGWANTDWFQEVYRKNVPSHEHNLSFTGGSKKFNFYLSGAVLDQNGLIRYGRDKFYRYNLNAKLNAEIRSWLRLSYNNRWVREDYSRPSYMTPLFFHNIARRWPTTAVTDPNGHLMIGSELIHMRDGGLFQQQRDNMNRQLSFTITPLRDWNIYLEGNYNTTVTHRHTDALPIVWYNDKEEPQYSPYNGSIAAGKTQINEWTGKRNYFNGRFYSDYFFTKDKHYFKIVAGMDMELSKWRDLSGTKKDLIVPNKPTINTATNDKPDLFGGYNHWSTMGFFARANYSYDDRYLLELGIRRDGSSRFVGDKTWGTFPSVSLGWNIANEAFFDQIREKLSLLKLRASWGSLGNTNIKALYPWFEALPNGVANSGWLINGQKVNTSNAPGIVSNTLTWESITSWNAGLDFAAFHNRLQGSFEIYNRYTFNMVGPSEPMPSVLGAGLPNLNNADMKTYGWEMELSWRDYIKDFNYGLKLVLFDDQQIITRYYNEHKTLDNWYNGRKNGEIWGYRTKGIAKTEEEMAEHLKKNKPVWGSNWAAGDIMYTDLNGDGKIDNGKNRLDDHGDLEIIGNSHPRYNFGINIDASWKGFDFAIFMQGIGKRDFWDASPYSTGASNHGVWQAAGFVEHWDFFRPKGDPLGENLNAYFPRPLFGQGGKNFYPQTRFLQDASYMRIKNLQLGYSLPKHLLEKVGMSRLRIYASVDNLATFTKMTSIFDPETPNWGGWRSAGKFYPLSRTWALGVNINF